MMKICFIGLGSIGKKHLINLTKVLKKRNISYHIDAMRSLNRELTEEIKMLIKDSYQNIEDLPDNYDVIFITNPTHLHYDTLKKIIPKTRHVFIEKPIFHTTNIQLEGLRFEEQSIYYTACPLRHTAIIQYAKKYVEEHDVFAAKAICSSYLPDWRKNIDYRNIYSAKKDQGGGVSLDLIHEWDYLTYLFGKPLEILNVKGKYSDLEIDSDDLSVYIGRYLDKVIEVHLDYFGRKTTRQLIMYTKSNTIYFDITNNCIEVYGEDTQILELEKEDMYVNEMNYFIDLIQGNSSNINDINQAINTLKIAIGEELN